jgi:LysR family transcriptional regulator, glycine cleavage system transcriptional activator
MRNLNSIPLSALRTVEAIARTGTLVRAAAELGVTAGALSQRLAKAETALGRHLFVRTSSGLKPTEICTAILPRLSRAISDLTAVVADISAVENTVLTVSVASIFASRWLIWRIRKFTEQNPTIRVRVEPRVEVLDLDRSEVDVGIRVGEGPAIGAGAIMLLEQKVFPVCSPDIAQHIKTPADLLQLPVIRENERLYGWDAWLSEHGLSVSALQPGPTYGDASLCLDAAMTGQGLFMAWETLACDALERGHIASPFRQRSKTGTAYWFATSRFSAQKTRVRKFRAWLQDELDCSVTTWRDATSG